ISSITPTGDSPSASIPFAGNAIWLHSPEGTPFAASYAVSAQVLPAENVNEISNMTAATTDGGGDGGAVDEAATAATATDGGGGDGGGDGGDEAATAATATNATDADAGDADGE
ncbi:MAG: hypothetical protein ACJ70U_04510, partial [Nitrososphaera sp.]